MKHEGRYPWGEKEPPEKIGAKLSALREYTCDKLGGITPEEKWPGPPDEKMTPKRSRGLLEEMQVLTRICQENDDEFRRCMIFAYVLLESGKGRIDYMAAAEDLGIEELVKKYRFGH